MDLVTEKVWRRFWYPVAFAEDVDDAPLSRMVLGEPLVLWRSAPGEVAVATDRCPHRDARLSQGWLCEGRIVCPYHGWQYGANGPVAVVPQNPTMDRFPPRFTLSPVRSAVRCGVVWVCLDDPIMDIPDLPAPDKPGWRWIREFDEEWDAHAARLMENSFDPAHTMFVHKNTFGDQQSADIETPVVERTETGLRIRSEYIVVNRPDTFTTTGASTPKTVRATVSDLYGPFFRVLRITYPSGLNHHIYMAATPVDNNRLRLVQWLMRDDTEKECSAADAWGFDRRVTLEDKTLLEGIYMPYTSDLEANVHIRVDRPTVTIRQIYADISAGIWPSSTTDEAPAC